MSTDIFGFFQLFFREFHSFTALPAQLNIIPFLLHFRKKKHFSFSGFHGPFSTDPYPLQKSPLPFGSGLFNGN
jgi:hypothetical protein